MIHQKQEYYYDSFFMAMKKPPTATKQQRKINWKSKKVYDSDQVKGAKAKLEAHLYKHKPSKPIDGPIMLDIVWAYPAGDGHLPGTFKTSRPDIDNMPTLLLDCMTRLGFWNDDAQVVSMSICKCWSDLPGIKIFIQEMPANFAS